MADKPIDFNPRSRVGNDWINRINELLCLNFNPRSRVGNDMAFFLLPEESDISIHVPAWGTTIRNFQQNHLCIHFNPRSRVGNDYLQIAVRSFSLFQSTFPRGERLNSNSVDPNTITISIHVPAWGTTWVSPPLNASSSISIHVPAWGTTKPVY